MSVLVGWIMLDHEVGCCFPQPLRVHVDQRALVVKRLRIIDHPFGVTLNSCHVGVLPLVEFILEMRQPRPSIHVAVPDAVHQCALCPALPHAEDEFASGRDHYYTCSFCIPLWFLSRSVGRSLRSIPVAHPVLPLISPCVAPRSRASYLIRQCDEMGSNGSTTVSHLLAIPYYRKFPEIFAAGWDDVRNDCC